MLKSIQTNKPLICITTGEPAGVGPEICLDLANHQYNQDYNLLLIGDINLLQERAISTGKQVTLTEVSYSDLLNPTKLASVRPTNGLQVLHTPCPQINCLGKVEVINAAYVLAILDLAIKICKDGLSNIIVTAPLNKDVINQSGIAFSGHTEYLAEQFNISKVVMMLSNPELSVALLTTHLPLKDVAAQVTPENLNQTIQIITDSFQTNFAIQNPRIAVCGLNPHAGENGYLGTEEITIINPVIQKWQQRGLNIQGSLPADTIFNHATQFDVILAMYHDQGLPVIKYSDFEHGVNTTLGLPIIRTSVDHGTALDIAGKGIATANSLFAAIKFATTKYSC